MEEAALAATGPRRRRREVYRSAGHRMGEVIIASIALRAAHPLWRVVARWPQATHAPSMASIAAWPLKPAEALTRRCRCMAGLQESGPKAGAWHQPSAQSSSSALHYQLRAQASTYAHNT